MDITIKKIVVGEIQSNCYIVTCAKTDESFIIDPGDDYEKINSAVMELKKKPSFIVNTHGHMDHIKEDGRFNLPVYIHRQDKECLQDPNKNLSAMFGIPFSVNVETIPLEDGDTIKAGKAEFKVLHTPGHSPGSICLVIGKMAFTGDTLFCNGYGRTDLPGGSEEKLFESIKKLMALPDETVIYPGHGPRSRIGRERNRI